MNKTSGTWSRAAIALAAAVVVGAVAAPLSMADPKPEGSQAAPAGDPDLLLATPEVTRVSDGSYSGFQFCGIPDNPPQVSTDRPSLAATLESVAPPGSVEPPEGENQPGRKVVFEVTEAGGEPVLTKQATTEASHTAIYQFSEGKLTDGDYRWRVRVQDGPATSQWTAWCDFSVRLSS
ncbi:hypothetical protein ABZ154_31645 [Streptomyces sp. NPDC006261]|uniref:hypothetical protein n=1 Tax=Streptomyces sp. NPDC006261 TaxID=3156739 RepID=UPI0033B98B69